MNHPVGSGSGLVVWTPAGATALRLAEHWIRRASVERLLGDEIVTPTLYPWHEGSPLQELAGTFADRLWIVDGTPPHVLRWNADPGLFTLLSGQSVAVADSPLRFWEICRCFRRNQSGELKGLRRMNEFTLHDHHSLCADRPAALDEYRRIVAAQLDLIRDWAEGFEIKFTVTEQAFAAVADFLADLSRETTRALSVVLDSRARHYWEMKHSITTDTGYSTFNTQLDVDNGRRFGLSSAGAAGPDPHPLILHTSLASPERLLLVAVAEAERRDPSALPLWLSPVQVRLLPNSRGAVAGAVDLARELGDLGVRADVDDRDRTVGWRIRSAAGEWVPYSAVVGPRELEGGPLNVRDRSGVMSERTARQLGEWVVAAAGPSPVALGELRVSLRGRQR